MNIKLILCINFSFLLPYHFIDCIKEIYSLLPSHILAVNGEISVCLSVRLSVLGFSETPLIRLTSNLAGLLAEEQVEFCM